MYPTMSYNQAQHGIELSFPGKPSQDVRDRMKSNGFRYHREKNVWYAKKTEAREKFARSLCGEKEISKDTAEPETLFRYYSRRPVDLGTYPKQEGSPVNIVNFDARIPVEEGKLTAWGYVEYAKPLSEKAVQDYELTPARDYAVQEQHAERAGKTAQKESNAHAEKKALPANCFAACYDKIGDIPILEDGSATLYAHTAAYIKDLNIAFRSFDGGNSLHITDLSNAGKNGKSCEKYAVFMRTWNSREPATLHLMNEHKIRSIAELYQALKEKRDLGGEVQIEKRELKGVETFSPFVETKPLSKIPDRWNKRNFTNALLSGQIYGGQVDQVLTDDYLYDNATNFREGTPICVPVAAKNAVEDWSSLASVRSTHVQPDGKCNLDYYNGYSTSKTYYFDLHCNIPEGKRREEQREAGIKRHNDMLMASCIRVSPETIDPGKIYTLTTVDTSANSGIYTTQQEHLQGHVLKERLDPEHIYMDILAVEELTICPEKLYSVANFFDRRSNNAPADERIISCGNWQQIVTGKALLELTGEGVYFPKIQEARGEYKDYQQAKKTLTSFANGTSRFMMGGENPDYNHSLKQLESEYARATAKQGLKDKVQSAEQRQSVQTPDGRDAAPLQR